MGKISNVIVKFLCKIGLHKWRIIKQKYEYLVMRDILKLFKEGDNDSVHTNQKHQLKTKVCIRCGIINDEIGYFENIYYNAVAKNKQVQKDLPSQRSMNESR